MFNLDDMNASRLSIDETSIKPGMMKEYCRSDKGKRCYHKTTNNKVFTKFTLLVAISTKGVIGYKLFEKGASNKERFLQFIQDNILSKYNNKLLLFDNAKSHTAKIVLKAIDESNNSYVLNVPYNECFASNESY